MILFISSLVLILSNEFISWLLKIQELKLIFNILEISSSLKDRGRRKQRKLVHLSKPTSSIGSASLITNLMSTNKFEQKDKKEDDH